jgi:hypothetical protein
VGRDPFPEVPSIFYTLVFRPLGVQAPWAPSWRSFGLLNGALGAGSGVGSGRSTPGTLQGPRSIFLYLLLLFLLVVLRSFVRPAGVSGDAENLPKILLRQGVDMEKRY